MVTRLLRLAAAPPPARTSAPSAPAAALPAAAPGGDPATIFLTDLLANIRDELNRADSKASLLLAAVGVIIGALLGGISSSRWTPMSLGAGEQALWWAGVVAAAVGVLLISASVYPRIRLRATPRSGSPSYYADVAAYPDVDAFRHAIGEAPDVRERLLTQSYVLARIVEGKYLQLQRALLSLLVAIIACALAIALNVLLS
jgi:hypothetical protein